ncbi:MAG: VWA domain-containing protein [Terracidiphilus sp.]
MRLRFGFSRIAAAIVSFGFLLIVPLGASSFAQTILPPATRPPGQPAPNASLLCAGCISINVDVTNKSGHPIGDLTAGDFTLLDNGRPATLVDFRAVDAQHPPADPVQVFIVLDAINTEYLVVARERDDLGAFLKQNGGALPYPTTIAFFTETGTNLREGPSQSGKVLLASLDSAQAKLRTMGRSAGVYGAGERLTQSLDQLRDLVDYETKQPGRKLLLLVSPGWPMLSYAGRDIQTKERSWIFDTVVQITNSLREANISLYVLYPFNVGDNYYQSFLKGVTKIEQAQYPDLALPVLAEHSGGVVIVNGNDIKGEINTAIEDASTYYTLTFDSAPASVTTDYHALSVKVDKPGLRVRTDAGYYVESGQASAAPHR